jgi:hypothetical protein
VPQTFLVVTLVGSSTADRADRGRWLSTLAGFPESQVAATFAAVKLPDAFSRTAPDLRPLGVLRGSIGTTREATSLARCTDSLRVIVPGGESLIGCVCPGAEV